MKKLFLMMAVVFSMAMASCGAKTADNAEATDVDSIATEQVETVDTLAADTLATDTVVTAE